MLFRKYTNKKQPARRKADWNLWHITFACIWIIFNTIDTIFVVLALWIFIIKWLPLWISFLFLNCWSCFYGTRLVGSGNPFSNNNRYECADCRTVWNARYFPHISVIFSNKLFYSWVFLMIQLYKVVSLALLFMIQKHIFEIFHPIRIGFLNY